MISLRDWKLKPKPSADALPQSKITQTKMIWGIGEGLQERLADEFFLGPRVVLRSLARPCVGWRIALRDTLLTGINELTEVIGEEREYWVADPWGVESF